MAQGVIKRDSVEDVTSEFTVNTSYVSAFHAKKYGRHMFLGLTLKTGVPSASELVSFPNKYKNLTGWSWFAGVTSNKTPTASLRLDDNSIMYFGPTATTEVFIGSINYVF